MGHEDINMTANVYTAVQGNLTTSEMLKLVGRGDEFRTTFLQQTYGEFGRISASHEGAKYYKEPHNPCSKRNYTTLGATCKLSNVELEVHDVAVLDDVLLALLAQLAGVAAALLAVQL